MQISNDIQRRYDDAMITTGYSMGIDHLHKEVLKFKEQGRMKNFYLFFMGNTVHIFENIQEKIIKIKRSLLLSPHES